MTKGQMVNYTEILPNLFKNRSSITLSEGTGMNKKTMHIRIGEDGNILMNCTIRDINNETIAEIINSKPVCIDEAFECTYNNDGLTIIDKKTKDVYLDFKCPSPSKIMLSGIQQWVIVEDFVKTDDELNVKDTQLKT